MADRNRDIQQPPRRRSASARTGAHSASASRSRSGAETRVQPQRTARTRVRDDYAAETRARRERAVENRRPRRDVPQEQEPRQPKRNKRAARPQLKGLNLLSRVFAAVILLLLVVSIAMPDAETSTAENRTLQTMPRLSWSTVSSGRFQEQFTDYVSDQFPLRTAWANCQVAISTLAGGFESNGVYRGKGGYLIQPFANPTDDKAAAAVEAFAANHSGMTIHALIAPTASSILSDKLPFGADPDDEQAYIASLKDRFAAVGVDAIDVSAALSAASTSEDVYFHTDHHWTQTGAYEAFKAAAAQLDVKTDTSYDEVLLTSQFAGSLKTKSGYFFTGDDSLNVYVPTSNSFNCIITYVEEQTKETSPYVATALDGTDAYQVFFGGNHARIRIESPNTNDRVLLVLKDSYANSFLPFLIDQYEKIVVVDPRYCYDDIDSVISDEGVTEVLFLYNADTFASDTSLAGMMGI